MASPILVTKLFIPVARPELVSRPRLIERLNEGLNRKLTLVSAPAGFGKTTLITEWLITLQRNSQKENKTKSKVSWLSLDGGDNDPTRFLTYFITALNQANGSETVLGKGAMNMLQSPQPPPTEAVLTSLINELAIIPDGFILVLDDYHLIDSQSVHEALTFLMENLPPVMHLVITTREDPHLPLSRMRARGQMIELRATDLRFTKAETADFLNKVMGLNLSEEDIAALENRTEGWIAGLQLAAISMQGHTDIGTFVKSFTGSHRLVLDYLIEEVLGQQPESIQNFLLQTSILNRLTGSLCNALTGQGNGQQVLETLERANLFIVTLDDERHWYRYHHLFADLLRERLNHTQFEQPSILHHKASVWYEQNGYDDEAIEHALSGNDFDRAAEIVDKHIDDIWGTGQHAVIQRWIAKLPDALVFSKPHLCVFHAWYLFVNGQREAAKQALEAAELAIKPDLVSDTKRLQGRVAAVQAFMDSYQGDLAETIQHAKKANEFLPEQDLTWRCLTGFVLGDALLYQGEMTEAYHVRLDTVHVSKETGHYYLILIANLRLIETLRHQGKLKQVIDLCEQQIQFVNECGISQTVAAGWLLALWGDVLVEMNELEKAITQAQKGAEIAGRGRRDVSFFGWSNLYLLRVLFSRGDLVGAKKVIEKMQNVVRDRNLPILADKQLSAWQARIWLEQDKLDIVSRWAKERGLNPDGELSFINESEYLVYARLFRNQGNLDQANELLQRLLEASETGGRTLRVIEILLLQALAYHIKGDNDRALVSLEKALAITEPEGFIRIFVDEGPPMARLLYEALSHEIAPDYVQRLLRAFPIEVPEKAGTPQPSESDSELIEPLSEREIEVLQLIAEGFSNQEISSRLYLSLNTVKAHTRNIYGKLGVNNRTQAGARARALGIISGS